MCLDRLLRPSSANLTDISRYSLDPSKMPGIELVTRIQKVAERHLESMISRLSASDRGVESLERQVRQLQGKINARKLMCKSGSRDPMSLNSLKEGRNFEKKLPGENKDSATKLTNDLIDIFHQSTSPSVKNQSTIQVCTVSVATSAQSPCIFLSIIFPLVCAEADVEQAEEPGDSNAKECQLDPKKRRPRHSEGETRGGVSESKHERCPRSI